MKEIPPELKDRLNQILRAELAKVPGLTRYHFALVVYWPFLETPESGTGVSIIASDRSAHGLQIVLNGIAKQLERGNLPDVVQ